MAFSLPDKGEGDNDIQSIMFQEYLEVLSAGISGVDCVIHGCVVTGGADMTPAVALGLVISNGVPFAVTAGDVTIGTADATNPRIDLIVVNSSGTKAVRAGTAAASPKPPSRTANDVVIAAVYVPANDTAIATSQITDLRVLRDRWSVGIALGSDAASNSTTTGVEITGLSIPLEAGTYVFQYFIRYQSAATTTGVKFGVNYTGTASAFMAQLRLATTGTTAVSAVHDQATTTTPTVMGICATRTESTTAPNLGPWTDIDTANADMLVIIEGLMVVSDAGDIELWHASEAAAASTVKAGTSLILTRTK